MKSTWLNSVFPIAAIFSFRMLGLFMLIPVFTSLAPQLNGATPALIGLALGSYGLSQGLLQIPFGLFSDRFGRKKILTLGLLIFALGSLVGALTHSIYGMILARILQGMGAIGSVLIALLADLTTDKERTKAMAIVGMTIGLSFSLALVISPGLSHHFGLAGIFYLTAILAGLGLLMLHLVIPNPVREHFHPSSETKLALLTTVIRNKHLQRLNGGIFLQHFILTATFYALPLLLQQQIQQGNLHSQWRFYLPLIVFSFIFMIPFILLSEKKSKVKIVFLSAIFVSSLSQLFLGFFASNWSTFCILLFLYFIAFNVLEASLPSLISKQAPSHSKGTAMGVYSSSQFLGIFVGGSCAGILYQFQGSQGIFIVNALCGLLWLIIAFFMKPNDYLSTLSLPLSTSVSNRDVLLKELNHIPGIKNISFVEENSLLYLQVDRANYVEGSADQIVQRFSG